jgi:hypothetical protein
MRGNRARVASVLREKSSSAFSFVAGDLKRRKVASSEIVIAATIRLQKWHSGVGACASELSSFAPAGPAGHRE